LTVWEEENPVRTLCPGETQEAPKTQVLETEPGAPSEFAGLQSSAVF